MEPEIEKTLWSIVLIGSFNPAIFHPSWLLYNGVISSEQYDNSEVKVVHKDITSLVVGPFSIDIEGGRFKIETDEAPDIRLLDFVSKVFGELLPHTKIAQFGFNKAVHFKVPDLASRIALGRVLAPIEPWGDFGRRMESAEPDMSGGMMSIQMRELLKSEGWSGHLEAKVEPSNLISGNVGVMVACNKHYKVFDIEDGDGAEMAIALLNSEYENGMSMSDEIIDQIMAVAYNG